MKRGFAFTKKMYGALRVIPGGNQVDGLPPASSRVDSEFLRTKVCFKIDFIIEREVLASSKI